MVFKSFGLPVGDGFHPPHQLSYLRDAVRILYYTRKIYNVYDVLVFLLDEEIMREQIDIAQNEARRDEDMTEQQRLNFKMSVRKLLQSFEDRERVPKIQGLINEMMNFLDDDMSVVTGQYQDLLTIEDVIDQELILFVSLNANKDTEPVVSLGRMILQDIQVSIGRRYESETHRNNANQPMFSVVMDEFAPFAYQNFAHILQTARGAKVAFLIAKIFRGRFVARHECHDRTRSGADVCLEAAAHFEKLRHVLHRECIRASTGDAAQSNARATRTLRLG
jgi:hypothetical protein